MREQEPNFTVLFGYLFKKITTSGLTVNEYDNLKNHPVGHGNLEEYINVNIMAGNFEWNRGRLFNAQRRNFLDLDDKHLKTLRLRAMELGLSEAEFAGKVVSEYLNK